MIRSNRAEAKNTLSGVTCTARYAKVTVQEETSYLQFHNTL